MPQPIDPNTEFMRIHAIQRMQEVQERAALTAQARQITQQAEEQIRRETTVNRPEPQEPAVDRETRRRTPFRNEMEQRERKKEQQQAEDEHRPDASHPSGGAEHEPYHFDVSI